MKIILLIGRSGTVKLFFLFALLLCYQISAAQAPAITSFSPLNGPVGSEVTVSGSNFNTTPASNIVFFGQTRALVTAASTTSLTVTVPKGASHAPITVVNTGASLSASSQKFFLPTFQPNTSSISSAGFAARLDFAVRDAYSATAVDLDGDGSADMVTANVGDDNISVLRNTGTAGTISFAPKQDISTGSSPTHLTFGDLNADGKPDLAVVNRGHHTVSVLINTSSPGNISFAAKVDLTTGTLPVSVAIADIDLDGLPDLVTANLGANSVSVIRNTGGGTFAPKSDYSTGAEPNSVAVADINFEGNMDIIVTSYADNLVSVIPNLSGAGFLNFLPRIDFTTPKPTHVSVSDIDGDGKPDMAITSDAQSKLSVFRNISTSNHVDFAPTVDVSLLSHSFGAAIADIDGDGKPDVVVSDYTQSSFSVFRNTSSIGTVRFSAGAAVNLGYVGSPPFLGDLDGDGKADLIALSGLNQRLSVFRNILAATQPYITSISPISGPVGTSVTISGGNFNTTGSNNTVFFGATQATVTAASSGSLTVTVPVGATHEHISVLNTGVNSTAFSPKPFLPTFPPVKSSIIALDFNPKADFASGVKPGYLAVGDLDGDGKADMATSNNTDNTVSLFLNNGASGSPSYTASSSIATRANPQGVAIGDIDGDGKPDMAITSYNTNSVSIYRNTSTLGNISFDPLIDVPLASCPFFVVIRDIDGDGRPDLVAANKDSDLISVVLNTGSVGAVSFAAKVDFPVGGNVYSVAVGDIDGDGKPDLAAANYGNSSIAVFRNTSIPGYVSLEPKIDITVDAPYSVSIGDVDGDGKADLVCAILMFNKVSVVRNTSTWGSISFATKRDFATGQRVYNVAIGDLDGDGKSDLATPNYNSNTVSVLRNTSSPGNLSFSLNTEIASGAGPAYVAIGDMDGDGKSDLLTANYLANTVSVLRNHPKDIIVSGTLSAVNTTYGTASPVPTSFTISGTNLQAGITVTPPAGFVVSKTPGGTSGYSTAIVVGSAGNIAATTIYVRLVHGIVAGTYSGDVVCTSTNAMTAIVATVSSTVSPAALTITAAAATRTYGGILTGGAGSSSFTAAGLQNSETVGSVTIAYEAGAGNGNTSADPVGTYTGKVIPSAATGGTFLATNYTITFVAGNLAVSPAALSITATNANRVYGSVLTGAAGSTGFTSSGLKNSETIGSVSLSYEAGAGNGNAATDAPGTYTGKVMPSAATGGSFTAANYTISYGPADLTVSPAPLTITATEARKIYGTTLSGGPASTEFTASGLVNSQTIGSVSISYETGAGNGNTSADPVGTYSSKVTPSAATGGSFIPGNYTISYAPADLVVSPAVLTKTASNASRVYGSVLSNGAGSTAFTTTGLKNSETIGSVSIAYEAGAGNGNTPADPVGTYSGKVSPSAATGGSFTPGNYTISYAPGNLIVSPAALTITASNAGRIYGSVLTGGAGSTAFTAAGLKNSETIGSLSIEYAAGTGNGNSATDPAGTYNGKVIPHTAAGGTFIPLNYTINYIPGNIIIGKAPLTITADNKTRAFAAPDPVFTASFTGFVQGETAANLSVQPVFSTDAVSNSPGGNYTISASGAAATNYTITYVNGILTISQTLNTAPTLASIANQVICHTQALQTIPLSGITAGAESTQTTVLSVSSSNSSFFSNLSIAGGSGGTGTLSYTLNPGTSGTTTVTITVKDNGGTANGGADTFSRTFTITVNTAAVPAIVSDLGASISKGFTARLTATGGTSYQWSNAAGIISGQNTDVLTVRPLMNTTYTVTATNAQGCTSVQSFSINVVEDYISVDALNVVTPNGDGKNDTWVVRNIDAYPNNTVKVFDRAGRIVYSKNGYKNDWDVSYNGFPLNQDTYYFVVDLGSGVPPVKGYISIVK